MMAFLAVPSLAQQSSPLAELTVRLWPEFDRPGVLVILQGTLDESVALPTMISLPLPPGVDEPFVVASAETDGPLIEVVSYDVQPGDEANWVTFETESRNVWLEYYDDLQREDDQRTYAFQWPGGVDIAQVSFEVLQPIGVEEVWVSPDAEPQLEDDGQVHYAAELGAIAQTDQFEIQFNYVRTQEVPSLSDVSDVDRLEALNVLMWPEFDQQAMLVILEIFLPEDVELPARVVLPLPARVPEPFAVAFVSQDEGLLNAVFELVPQGQWNLLTIEAEGRELRVEYYDILAMDGQQRSYRYSWPGGIAIDRLGFEVLPPVGAEDVRITPGAQRGQAASGQPLYAQALGAVAAQETLDINVAYRGEEVAFERPEGVTGGTPDVSQWLPWVIGGIVLLLAGSGGWIVLRNRKPKPKKRRRRSSSKPKQSGSGLDAAAVFCHVCGARSTISDHFCRQCGSKLRT
jgi:hypothetical protein